MAQIHLFTKELKPTDIDYTLSVPASALHAFPIPHEAHTMDFEAVDAAGFAWQFRLATRVTGPYLKPVLLQSFWQPYVKHKGLIPKDRVIFFIEQNHEVTGMRYAIRAQRKIITLMGQDVWINVEDLDLYGL